MVRLPVKTPRGTWQVGLTQLTRDDNAEMVARSKYPTGIRRIVYVSEGSFKNCIPADLEARGYAWLHLPLVEAAQLAADSGFTESDMVFASYRGFDPFLAALACCGCEPARQDLLYLVTSQTGKLSKVTREARLQYLGDFYGGSLNNGLSFEKYQRDAAGLLEAFTTAMTR